MNTNNIRTWNVTLATAQDTQSFGQRLGAALAAGDLVILTGDLGAGKTTLTQGIGRGLGVRGQVASPTFVIARVHPSVSSGPALVHVDAYRLGSLDDVDALDLDESLEDCVTVVEWGAGLVETLAGQRLEIALRRPRGAEIDVDGDETRHVTLTAYGERWSDLSDVVGKL